MTSRDYPDYRIMKIWTTKGNLKRKTETLLIDDKIAP